MPFDVQQYYQQREERIRKEWFPNHVAQWEKFVGEFGNRELHALTWRRPDTTNYYCRYVIDGRVLVVYGDIGDAVYGWSDKLTWEFLVGLDYHYFASKCMGSENGRLYKGWDGRVAQQKIKDQFSQDPSGSANWSKACGIGGEPSLHRKEDWQMWLHEHGFTAFGECYYEMGNIGEVIDLRCQGHLTGIKMAFDQLKSQTKV